MSNRHPNDFPVDPYVVNGGVLAERLTRLVESLDTRESGYARPSYAQRGTIWLDESNIIGSPSTIKMMVFDGAHDVLLHEVNVDSGEVIGGGGIGGRAWDDLQQYKTGDVVTEATFLYIAIQDSTGSAPSTHPADWLLFDLPDYDGVIPYADIAALRDAPIGTDSVAYLSQDGRSGHFKWSSANHAADVTADTQSGIYVAPGSDLTGASGAWVRQHEGAVNVRWFGAVGDDIFNDAIPFQSAFDFAFDNGKSVFIPVGDYRIESQLNYRPYVHIYGEGTGSKLNSYITDGYLLNFDASSELTGPHNVTISDLYLCGTNHTGMGGAISVTSSGHAMHIRNNWIRDFNLSSGVGIYGYGDLYYLYISENHINSCNKGIYFDGSTGGVNNVVIKNCQISSCSMCIHLLAAPNTVINSCQLENTGYCGVRIEDSPYCKISGCWMERNPAYDILLIGSHLCSMEDLYTWRTATDPDQRSIRFSNSDDNRVVSCYFGNRAGGLTPISFSGDRNEIIHCDLDSGDMTADSFGTNIIERFTTTGKLYDTDYPIFFMGGIYLSSDVPANIQNGVVYSNHRGLIQRVDGGDEYINALKNVQRSSTAAPTTGAWNRGDVSWNTLPSAGGSVGWVCTAGGSPGTWKAFGAINA